jgi:hypothetical protein
MPRYFFHFQEESGVVHDSEGMSFSDLTAARDEAIAGARSIIAESVKAGVLPLSNQIDIQDEAGQTLITITFADTVAVR